jgi:ABC-type transport system involved in cytochrome bd biosynthesis fused ATPase/permease subunit
VVLDEPTAHLDPDAEAVVTDAIGRLGEGRTVVVISHRPALAVGADAVIQLARGRRIR